jgi:hypothetical protein
LLQALGRIDLIAVPGMLGDLLFQGVKTMAILAHSFSGKADHLMQRGLLRRHAPGT